MDCLSNVYIWKMKTSISNCCEGFVKLNFYIPHYGHWMISRDFHGHGIWCVYEAAMGSATMRPYSIVEYKLADAKDHVAVAMNATS